MTAQDKELIALRRLLYQVNRFMWTSRGDNGRLHKAVSRLSLAWRIAEARSVR
jgi:hypothetical protein